MKLLRSALRGILFDDASFRDAVKVFYDSIKSFKQPSLAGVYGNDYGKTPLGITHPLAMSYRELAAYFVNMLSLDYTIVKNQAILSFLFYIMENPLLSVNLDSVKMWEANSDAELVNGLTEKTIPKISPLRRVLLINLYALMKTGSDALEVYKKTEDEIMLELLGMASDINNIVKECLKRYQKSIQFIRENEEALGYIKIINLSGLKLSNFDKYISDTNLMELVDRITDRMIINNYAGEFFEKWSLFNIMNGSMLKKYLVVGARQKTALNYIVERVSRFTSYDGITADECMYALSPVVEPVVDNHTGLRKAYQYYQNCSYYRFCESIASLPDVFESYVNVELTKKLINAVASLKSKCKPVLQKKEYEFYLPWFSPEEIAGHEEELELLSFGRRVPYRVAGEDINSYLKRFLELQESQAYDYVNSYDYLRNFQEIADEIYILSAAVIFSSIEYSSYSTAVFMGRALNLVNLCGNTQKMYDFINVSGSFMNLVNNSTDYLDISKFERDKVHEFVHMISRYYFTSVSEFVDSLLMKYENIMLYCNESLNVSIPGNSKSDMIKELVTMIFDSEDKASSDDSFSPVDTMINELLETIENPEFVKIIGD